MTRPAELTSRQKAELRRQGFSPNERALQRLIRAARDRRIAKLMAMGIPQDAAKAQAEKEFAEYDLIEFHESGWLRIANMNFYPKRESSS